MTIRCSVLWSLLLIVVAAPLSAQTWYIRPDGGSRSRPGVPGQCDGKADAPYPGSGVDRHCAFNDFRLLYDDKSYNGIGTGWIIHGGDTVIIRGCHNPGPNSSSPTACRIGGDPPGTKDTWCVGGNGLQGCSSGPIPSGTAARHTRILGENYQNCSSGGVIDRSRLAQLFGGSGLGTVLNLQDTSFVDVQCIDITDHSDCVQHGVPSDPRPCTPGVDDYASNGVAFNSKAHDILLQDVRVHGFTTSGIYGPIGPDINLVRVDVSFNGFAGWNFDQGNQPDAPGASIDAHYVTMIGNGCNEEYPVQHAFPAVSCYDLNSGGFGDSWSGQDASMVAFTCDHCIMAYNTKDGFIGPHTEISRLTITNSQSYGNMGQQWKWGGAKNSTTVFENNLTVGNCQRMSAPLPGAPPTFNQHLSLFCRAGGDVFSFFSAANGTVIMANNTTIGYSDTMFDFSCQTPNTCGSAHYLFRNNIVLGFLNPKHKQETPGLFYFSDPSVKIGADHDLFYNLRSRPCPLIGGNSALICENPQFDNQPPLTLSSESQLDNFNWRPSHGSPALGHGVAISGLTVDFFGAPRPNPPSIGAVEPDK